QGEEHVESIPSRDRNIGHSESDGRETTAVVLEQQLEVRLADDAPIAHADGAGQEHRFGISHAVGLEAIEIGEAGPVDCSQRQLGIDYQRRIEVLRLRAGGDLDLEAFGELGDAIELDAQPGCHAMATEALEAIAARGQRLVEIEPGDAATRATPYSALFG